MAIYNYRVNGVNEFDRLSIKWKTRKFNVDRISVEPNFCSNVKFIRENLHTNYMKKNFLKLKDHNRSELYCQLPGIPIKEKFDLLMLRNLIRLGKPLKSLIADINFIVLYAKFYGHTDVLEDYKIYARKNPRHVIGNYQRASDEAKAMINLNLLFDSCFININYDNKSKIVRQGNRYWALPISEENQTGFGMYNPYTCKLIDGSLIPNPNSYEGKVNHTKMSANFTLDWTSSFTFGFTFYKINLELKNYLQKTIENFSSIKLFRGMSFVDVNDFIKFIKKDKFHSDTFTSWSPDINIASKFACYGKYNVILEREFIRDELLVYFKNFSDRVYEDEYICLPGVYDCVINVV
jgi:hypothetical protein